MIRYIALVFCLFLSSCETVSTHDFRLNKGEPIKIDRVATVYFDNDIRMVDIDGIDFHKSDPDKYITGYEAILSEGTHKFIFYISTPSVYTSGNVVLNADLKSGSAYKLDYTFKYGKVYFEIVEVKHNKTMHPTAFPPDN